MINLYSLPKSASWRSVFAGIMLFGGALGAQADEQIFAGYFDVEVGADAGTPVIGKIQLERNKDVFHSPIPTGYTFRLKESNTHPFVLTTKRDAVGRIFGELRVAPDKKLSKDIRDYALIVELMNGAEVVEETAFTIHAVEETLWETMYERYAPLTVGEKGSRMYGRKKLKDKQVAKLIDELLANNGRLPGYTSYDLTPWDYLASQTLTDKHNEKEKTRPTIEKEWELMANQIGGLGYAYARSEVYGPSGDAAKRKQLKTALYKALIAYTNAVPVEGDDLEVDGKPIGKCTGDGFSLLQKHRWVDLGTPTHQWVVTDPLVAPAVQLMPELIEEMEAGDALATEVHEALVRYFQIFTSIIERRRAIDDPTERWREIQDTLSSSGAWADANLGHRLRTMLALPIIWADYNRPMTYVQYWYKDYYQDKPFENFSFSPGWSPTGVVEDVAYWMTKFGVPSRQYVQSGFHPDGTVSHHTGHGGDVAMNAYGFGWLTECFYGFNQLKDTPFQIADAYYQFPLQRLLHVYPKFIYNQQFDFAVSGRSFLADMNKFVMKTYLGAIDHLQESANTTTQLDGLDELLDVADQIKKDRFQMDLTEAFWVSEALVHRRGGDNPYYSSLKLKSQRTVGAEDFDRKVRKSWHTGSGVLQLKIEGNEYDDQVLKNWDWHVLPGVTEEWRTDPLPRKGGAQASLPGENIIAGVVADGAMGMGMYHHFPQETYSSATALKSYFFGDDYIYAMGSDVTRYRKGQGKPIVTCVDQAAFDMPLKYEINGRTGEIKTNESVDLVFDVDRLSWIDMGGKSVILYPGNPVRIQTGSSIHVTDERIANDEPNYIVAIDHGVEPSGERKEYQYVLLPHVDAKGVKKMISSWNKTFNLQNQADLHLVDQPKAGKVQLAAYKPTEVKTSQGEIAVDGIAMVMLDVNDERVRLTVGDPTADHQRKQLVVTLDLALQEGRYDYSIGGIEPRAGEFAVVRRKGGKSVVTVELADEQDAAYYNHRSALYAAAPIVLDIPRLQ